MLIPQQMVQGGERSTTTSSINRPNYRDISWLIKNIKGMDPSAMLEHPFTLGSHILRTFVSPNRLDLKTVGNIYAG